MTKLTEEQRDQMDEMVQSEAWPAMLAFCQMLIEQAENRVLTCDISKTDREMVLLKAKLEGARDVQRSIFNAREQIGQPRKKSTK